jgi:hypothetical protein
MVLIFFLKTILCLLLLYGPKPYCACSFSTAQNHTVLAPSLRPKTNHADLSAVRAGAPPKKGPLRPAYSKAHHFRDRNGEISAVQARASGVPDPYKHPTLAQNPASTSHPLRLRSSRRRRVSSSAGRPRPLLAGFLRPGAPFRAAGRSA